MEKLSKFPVTTSEGNEYRVTLTEREESDWARTRIEVRVYVERKRPLLGIFRFRCVNREVFRKSDGYIPDAPFYITFARISVERYEEWLASKIRKNAESEEARIYRMHALTSFNEWDGRIINKKDGGNP